MKGLEGLCSAHGAMLRVRCSEFEFEVEGPLSGCPALCEAITAPSRKASSTFTSRIQLTCNRRRHRRTEGLQKGLTKAYIATANLVLKGLRPYESLRSKRRPWKGLRRSSSLPCDASVMQALSTGNQ
jgi:hypothetical protein